MYIRKIYDYAQENNDGSELRAYLVDNSLRIIELIEAAKALIQSIPEETLRQHLCVEDRTGDEIVREFPRLKLAYVRTKSALQPFEGDK